MKKYIWLALLFLFVFIACKKSDLSPAPNDPSVSFSYISLKADKDTIENGHKTKIISTATGNGLTYHWQGPVGIITGSGHEVFFFACCPGDHWITCTVKDNSGRQEAKTINIHALE